MTEVAVARRVTRGALGRRGRSRGRRGGTTTGTVSSTLYVGNYETWGPSNALYCWPDFLYKNNGNGTFTDVSWPSGIRDADGDGIADESYVTSPEQDRRCVRGVTWGDYNHVSEAVQYRSLDRPVG